MSAKIPVQEIWAKNSYCNNQAYLEMYQRSINDPEGFWGEQAKSVDWFTPWSKVKEGGFSGDVRRGCCRCGLEC